MYACIHQNMGFMGCDGKKVIVVVEVGGMKKEEEIKDKLTVALCE